MVGFSPAPIHPLLRLQSSKTIYKLLTSVSLCQYINTWQKKITAIKEVKVHTSHVNGTCLASLVHG